MPRLRGVRAVFRASLPFIAFVALGAALAATPSCGGGDGDGSSAVGDDSGLEDIPPWEEPILDGDDPAGRVVLLKPYDPKQRCYLPPTAVGHPDEAPGGGIAPCGKNERCYVRTDGVVFYAKEDCVHGKNFLFHVDDLPYDDKGPCEPSKHLDDVIKSCPNASCTYARDVRIDTTRGCATAIVSRACRDAGNVPTTCLCSPSSSTEVFVAFDGRSTTNAPEGFVACDATNAACKAALAIVDTVEGCR
jgi:hypothetical protein